MLLRGLLLFLSLLFLFQLFLELCVLLLLLLLFLLELCLSRILFVVGLASVDDDLLSSLLVGEEVGVSPEEAEDGVEEGVDVSFLLDDGHEDAVEAGLFSH